ncbi:MAG: hypothetical protein JST87_03745 [Bacteroidetes bacterium]|nr:hypothetical protein [Bacteroidota bacterium]
MKNWKMILGEILKLSDSIVRDIYELRKMKVGDFSSAELRIMITQNIRVEFLLSKALDFLQKNIL